MAVSILLPCPKVCLHNFRKTEHEHDIFSPKTHRSWCLAAFNVALSSLDQILIMGVRSWCLAAFNVTLSSLVQISIMGVRPWCLAAFNVALSSLVQILKRAAHSIAELCKHTQHVDPSCRQNGTHHMEGGSKSDSNPAETLHDFAKSNLDRAHGP